MRKSFILFAFLLGCIGLQAQEYHINLHRSGSVIHDNDVNEITEIVFQGHNPAMMVINAGSGIYSFPITEFDSITFFQKDPTPPEPPAGDTVYITFNGNSVSVVNPFASTGVTVTNTDAEVVVNSTLANVPYVISGSSSNGSLIMYSTHNFFMALSSLSLSNTSTAAINIASEVSATLQLRGTSTLADGTGHLINGALNSAGDLSISGDSLNITGNDKHAINTEGTLTINSGSITVVNADTDGLHANAFVQNGGSVIVNNCGSDGIETTTNCTISNGDVTINVSEIDSKGISVNGSFVMSNGQLDITTSGTTSKGIKADNQLVISGGTVTIHVNGEDSNAMSCDTDIMVVGGDINIEMPVADCKGLNSNGTIAISGGTIDITSAGASNKGIKADDNITISAGTLTMNISGDNANGISSDVNVTVSNTANITITTSALDGKGIKSDGTIDITGGSVNITHSGNTSKGISADGNINISGGTIVINANGSTVVTDNEPSYCTAIKGDADINISGGDITIVLPTSNQGGKGIKSAGNMTISGNNNINIETHGHGATYTASSGTDVYSSSCLRSEGDMQILSGNITLTSSGNGGKGIKVGTKTATGSSWGGTTYTYTGTYTQGNSDGTGPTLTVSTTGSEVGSSGGGWGPGGGSSSSAHASAKAIKVGGIATIYGGTTTVSTTKNKAEGFESKTQINVEGGQHYFHCYDDCINSAGKIFFNGGVTVCYGYGNDAIDSNAGTAGAITIGNGVAFAYTTKGDPEEGFDCDNNSYIRITGTGIGISAGGSQGGGGGWGPGGGGGGNTITGAVQGYYFHTSSYSFQTGRYYTLSNTSGSGGSNLVTFSFEGNCTSKLALITATGMQHGSTYYVKYGTQAPTNPTTVFHGLYLGGTSSASTQAFSFTAQ